MLDPTVRVVDVCQQLTLYGRNQHELEHRIETFRQALHSRQGSVLDIQRCDGSRRSPHGASVNYLIRVSAAKLQQSTGSCPTCVARLLNTAFPNCHKEKINMRTLIQSRRLRAALSIPAALTLLALSQCSHRSSIRDIEVNPPIPPDVAIVRLQPLLGQQATGVLTFTELDGEVMLTGIIKHLEPGSSHGIHIHEIGDCTAADGSSAGGHYAPFAQQHGRTGAQSHLGDLENVTADDDGVAFVTKRVPGASFADSRSSILGRAVVLHAGQDDLQSQPSGNSGARIACGVITEGRKKMR
ncbi:MAG: superoxide dismutase family protein [Myxococcota bacterium]